MAQVQLRDPRGHGIPNLYLELAKASQPTVEDCRWGQFTDDAGNTDMGLIVTAKEYEQQGPYTVYVNYHNIRPRYGRAQITVNDFHEDARISVPRASAPANPTDMPRPDGLHFRDAAGKRQVLLICDQFRAFQWWKEGRDIEPLIQESKDLGFGWWRTFFYYDGGIGQFRPSLADLDGAGEFADNLNYEGIGLLAVALADNPPQQQERWRRLGAALRGTRTILSLANEADKNDVDQRQFDKIEGVLCSRGSRTQNEPPFRPYWDVAEFHGVRHMPTMANDSVASPLFLESQGLNVPLIMDEPIGWDDVPDPGRRLGPNDIALGAKLAGSFATWNAALCYHSRYGIQSQLLSPDLRRCALAWNQAAQAAADALADL